MHLGYLGNKDSWVEGGLGNEQAMYPHKLIVFVITPCSWHLFNISPGCCMRPPPQACFCYWQKPLLSLLEKSIGAFRFCPSCLVVVGEGIMVLSKSKTRRESPERLPHFCLPSGVLWALIKHTLTEHFSNHAPDGLGWVVRPCENSRGTAALMCKDWNSSNLGMSQWWQFTSSCWLFYLGTLFGGNQRSVL